MPTPPSFLSRGSYETLTTPRITVAKTLIRDLASVAPALDASDSRAPESARDRVRVRVGPGHRGSGSSPLIDGDIHLYNAAGSRGVDGRDDFQKPLLNKPPPSVAKGDNGNPAAG